MCHGQLALKLENPDFQEISKPYLHPKPASWVQILISSTRWFHQDVSQATQHVKKWPPPPPPKHSACQSTKSTTSHPDTYTEIRVSSLIIPSSLLSFDLYAPIPTPKPDLNFSQICYQLSVSAAIPDPGFWHLLTLLQQSPTSIPLHSRPSLHSKMQLCHLPT